MDQEHPQQRESLNEEQEKKQLFLPVGSLLFVMLMLIGYVIYWGYVWYLVVIERG